MARATHLDRFCVLTEYECGRAQIAIEWVARAGKPIVEIGGRPIDGCDVDELALDLNRCIERSGEKVKAFIIPDRAADYCCYGFYQFPWALQALLDVWGIERAAERDRSLWQQGLVFGYSADAIHKFILSASVSPRSNSHSSRRSEPCHHRTVEIYGSLKAENSTPRERVKFVRDAKPRSKTIGGALVIATLSKRLFDRLKRAAYRHAYISEHVRTGVAYQIRALREQRGWQQKKLAQEMGKPQSVVSRLEDPDYGKLSVQTLLEVAKAFDVALLIQYVSVPEFLRRTRDVSQTALEAKSFDEAQLRAIDLPASGEIPVPVERFEAIDKMIAVNEATNAAKKDAAKKAD